ncbi:transglycosylase domain-containing protein [Microbacterium sorbitolivorans]|uniref:PASTA domain-containing protein n=1 Tax=Microbacterium sorbitolivorans TaxID=1867410 RepID=A0A367Y016_9MICO|nr:transglycosylase domain-containing protein [Microbacterium sorbitolivorans]RCK58402.1 PASTA domain-containing protein [Microbacterium sorbitolivorans]
MPHAKRTFGGVLGGLLGLVGLSAIAGILVTATVTPAIAVSGYAASSAISLFDSLPGNLQIDRPMEPTTIYAQKGDGSGEYYELASFYDQNREPVEYNQVSQYVYDALLSTEDPRFFEHGGVDLIGTGRALLSNAVSDDTQGGSSISQQYVKGVQLQVCERTATDDEELAKCASAAATADGVEGYQRKLQEMRYAITIEQEYSKEQILIGYLNLVNFGGSTYGIEAAAQYYFDTTAKDLSLSQAATLVGIVNNPNILRLDYPDSETNGADNGYAAAKNRRDQVLGRMLAEGTISQKQYDETIDEAIEPKITERIKGCSAAGGSAYFCQYVTNTVLNDTRYDDAFGEIVDGDNTERQNILRRGGLEIYTTLDNSLQYEAQQAMANNAPQYIDNIRFGATTVQLDNKTGNILTLAQNTRFSELGDKTKGESAVIFAADQTHGAGTGFSAGSTYKIFTIIDWLKNGRSVNEVLDGRVGRTMPMTCNGSPIGSATPTRGDNFAGNGGLVGTVQKFTELSLNSGFWAMASQLDVCEIHQVATDMGLTRGDGEPIASSDDGAYSILGSKNIAPIDMAAIYAAVANGGTRCEPTAIVSATDADGNELPMPENECANVLDENIANTTAYDMRSVMEGSQGSGASARVGDGIQTFGKTGTHQNIQSWMIQSSRNVTTATWVGNFDAVYESDPDYNGALLWQYSKNVNGENGDSKAYQGDLFQTYANGVQLSQLRYSLSKANQAAANAKFGGDNFPDPDPNLIKTTKHPVPSVAGMSVDQATQTLKDKGFTVYVDPNKVNGDQEDGLVESTSPSGEAPAGSLITLKVSNGKGSIEVPNIKGKTYLEANDQLFDAGLRVWRACTEKDDAPEAGRVVRTDPAAGSYLSDGDRIDIYYEAKSCDDDNSDD